MRKSTARCLLKKHIFDKKTLKFNKKIEQLCRENLPCNVGKRIVEIL